MSFFEIIHFIEIIINGKINKRVFMNLFRGKKKFKTRAKKETIIHPKIPTSAFEFLIFLNKKKLKIFPYKYKYRFVKKIDPINVI
tara:strand:+ start:110 stop:364 length:255 start_codon:yes stop_codon:yes gene_type:complete